jgi:glycosyltransferase involved in cell wall biosynthesis/GT2 family glycosyltransferase
LKVVSVQTAFPALSATFILDQLTGLLDRGFDLEIWATRDPGDPCLHPEMARYRLRDRTRYLAVPGPPARSYDGRWLSEFFALNPFVDLAAIRAFHVHYGSLFRYLEPLFRVWPGFVLVSFHGHDASRYLRREGRSCYSYLFQRASLVTTPTYRMKAALVRLGCSPAKVIVHRYGVDRRRFRPVPSCRRPGIIRLLTVARLVEKKGLEYALRAIAALREDVKLRYRIVGDGPLRDSLARLAHTLCVDDRVEFLGPRDRRDVRRAMAEADIFVLPSVTASDGDEEGLPVSLVEAQAMGLPVVSTYHAGIAELILHGRTGYLAPERDWEVLADHIKTLACNAPLRGKFSRDAVEHVKAEFDLGPWNDRLAGYLRDALTPPAGPPTPVTAQPRTAGAEPLDLDAALARTGWEAKGPLYLRLFRRAERLGSVGRPALSVVVIAWRPHPALVANLRCLAAQRAQRFELIFVNNGAPERSLAPVTNLVDTYVRLRTNSGAYLGRNVGALFARAPILLFLDDDALPADDLIAAHLEVFRRYQAIAVRGAVLPLTPNPLNCFATPYHLGDRPFPCFADIEGNTAYDAAVFYRAGGWDDRIRFGGGGFDLSGRLLEVEPDRRKQIYSPLPKIYHDYAADKSRLREKWRAQARSWSRLRRKHPDYKQFLRSWDRFAGRSDLLLRRPANALASRAAFVK